MVSDFEMMLARKKDERRKRKRKDVDIINDNDDLIDNLIQQMRAAYEVLIFSTYSVFFFLVISFFKKFLRNILVPLRNLR